ncbi:MAG: helix-turn-helix domain-containing protein, partial [Lachnospiraceae bacterium]|nr:helix-turn-helix domain-containing protein [Lachnospiraceae bacterium]
RNMTVFFKNLDDFLKKNPKIKQKDICEAANLDKSAYNIWKKGSLPKVDTALKIAQFLGTSVEWLVTGRDAVSETFSREEVELVRRWRAIKDDDRQTVALLLNTFYDKTQTALEKKEGTEKNFA